MITAVIGKNFGDEGKGLAVDSFCSRVPHCLVVKHNGGAQAGHTVCFEGHRFVFHQLSSGSFRGADTYWATTYYPDLFKLREEVEGYLSAAGPLDVPNIYASKDTTVTIIDDVILNMALETSRGDSRHGSCGMGINEADLRTRAGFKVTFGELRTMDAESLAARLSDIRREYVIPRFKRDIIKDCDEIYKCEGLKEYAELLESEEVLHNAAQEMIEALRFVEVIEDEVAFLRSRENIIFESGQGLLLDSENKEFAPHVTASRTGLYNVGMLLKKAGLTLTEACYVSRTYVTRHGAGPLPCECGREKLFPDIREDMTNVGNPWQGCIRYAKHESMERFLEPVVEDLEVYGSIMEGEASDSMYGQYMSGSAPGRPCVSLFLTHLNETDSRLLFENGDAAVDDWIRNPRIRDVFRTVYLSYREGEQAERKDF